MQSDCDPGPRRAPVPRTGRNASISVEPLEARALLSTTSLYSGFSAPAPAAANQALHARAPSGIVTKAPHFYQSYTGPHLAELNAVKASAELSADGSSFTFTGTNAGRIKTAPAVYVWGIDRNGNLPVGPFTGRPNIKFDAVVVVRLDSSLAPSASITDLSTGNTVALPSGSASIHGSTVSVTVPTSLLPSTGLAPSQYHFNYWPEDGGPPQSSSVASFAPEATTAQVGVSKPHGR